MATSSLILTFGTLSGEKKWTFSNVKSGSALTLDTVKNLMNVMIENGSIYQTPPLSKVKAVVRTVSDDPYNVLDD